METNYWDSGRLAALYNKSRHERVVDASTIFIYQGPSLSRVPRFVSCDSILRPFLHSPRGNPAVVLAQWERPLHIPVREQGGYSTLGVR